MEFPRSKVAPCAIFFGAHGGKFTVLGNVDPDEDDRLLCGKAFDCGHCGFLHQWLQVQVNNGFSCSWECDACLRFSKKFDEENGTRRILTGYYQAGRKPVDDPNSLDGDPDNPGLEGCTHVLEADNPATGQLSGQVCGWETSFLQLVLRRRDVQR